MRQHGADFDLHQPIRTKRDLFIRPPGDRTISQIWFEVLIEIVEPPYVPVTVTDKHLVSRRLRHGEFLSFNTESSPNVEYGKMWSEPDECALGADFRVIDSTFYFS